jgi:hypothetical protein
MLGIYQGEADYCIGQTALAPLPPSSQGGMHTTPFRISWTHSPRIYFL